MTSRAKRPVHGCPLCKTELADSAQFERVSKEFENDINRRLLESNRKQSAQFREMIKGIKAEQRIEIQKTRMKSAEQMQEYKNKLVASARKEKDRYKAAIATSKKRHQTDLRNLRDVYDKEMLRSQKEQEANFTTQLKEISQNYGNVAAGHQKELERLKKMHDEDDSLIRRKDSEITKLKIDLVKASSQLEMKELSLQLHERNDTIKKLNGRIAELENRLAPAPKPSGAKGQNKTLSDDEQKEKLKEYMRAIIEITRNQQAEKKRIDSAEAEENAQEQGESKANKLFSWFF